MKKVITIIATLLAFNASADELQSAKLDYMLQQNANAVTLQSRQIEILSRQLGELKRQQQQMPYYGQQPLPQVAQQQYVQPQPTQSTEMSDAEKEYNAEPLRGPTYSGDTTLLPGTSTAPVQASPTSYVTYGGYRQPVLSVNYVRPQQRYRYVQIPTATLPLRYAKVYY